MVRTSSAVSPSRGRNAPEAPGRRRLVLRIPNLVPRGLYVERLREGWLPASPQREAGNRAAETLYLRGDPTPLGDFIEAGYFRVLSNRDYP